MLSINSIFSNSRSLLKFHLLLNLIIAVFITLSSYFHIPLNSVSGVLSYFLHFCILQFTIFGFTYLLSLNRYVFKILFPVLFFVFSIVGYWGYTHDISVDGGVIQASLETKPYIIAELISFPLILYCLAAILSILLVIKQYNKLTHNFSPVLLIFSISGIFIYFFLNDYRHNTLSSRLPYNVITGIKEYTKEPKISYKPLKENIKKTNDEINIVFILGESVRADHLGINNYKRNTTPFLNEIENLISFDNLYTNRSYTSISIPQILSDEPMYPENNNEYISLIDLLNKIGVSTTWIGNQVPETSFSHFIDNSEKSILVDPFRSVYSFHNASDLELVPYFENHVKGSDQKFILLHMLGSHWMYHKRYDKQFEKFTPTAKSKYLPSNSREEMINAYDNTILLLDYFIDEVINTIKEQNDKTLLIYLSDHGEALGENGKYLHAFNSPEVDNPAGMIWFSPELKKSNPDWYRRINSVKNNHIELDFFFPTILDVLEVENIEYEKEKSLLYK